MARIPCVRRVSAALWCVSLGALGCQATGSRAPGADSAGASGAAGVSGVAGASSGAAGVSSGVAGSGAAGAGKIPEPMGGTNNAFIDMSSTAMGRLTNNEYSQTVTDVLGEPAAASVRYRFPEDPREHGFDNNVDLLQVSTAHVDRYAAAAEAIATATFAMPTRKALVLSCDPAAAGCLNSYIQKLGRRLYRRPLGADEVAGFVALATAGAVASDPTSGPRTVLQAMLVSPYFLYRLQVGVADAKRTGIVGLDGFEIATRLSYLLLGTTPDDPLLDKAQGGMLDTPAGVNAVVASMMADARVRTGMKRFYGQWLPLTQISGPSADGDRMPHMGDPVLAADLVEETSRFVDDVFWDSGGSVLDLLTARYTYVNANLAKVYGMPAPAAGTWQKVMFAADSPRSGVLTQGAILAAGSHSDKPSNTRRGEMVREQLLCVDIPSPPPGVAANPPAPKPGETEQQTFASHTTMASCATCHNLMDPIGWGLSGFDAAGAIRTKDSNGQPISVKGQVSGLTPPDFNGPVELGQKLAASDQYKACFAKQLFRYVYGRMETASDADGITQLKTSFDTNQWKFSNGLVSLVESDGFRYRTKGDAP
jgi:hypothetical protein